MAFNSLRCLFYLSTLNPYLALLAWSVKRSGKTFLGYLEIASLVRNFIIAKERFTNDLQVAEFGVGRGGSAIILGKLIDLYGGTLVLYDLFGRIPPPTEKDGEKANRRYHSIISEKNKNYYGNINNLYEVIVDELRKVCDIRKVEFVVGRFEEVLPRLTEKRSFGFVHIDCDWYESYKAVLTYLKNNLRSGAILQLDDYYSWEGVPKAVAEAIWLSQYKRWKVGTALVIDTNQIL